jgi:hypothetical protein
LNSALDSRGSKPLSFRTHEDSEGSVVYATEYHGWFVTHSYPWVIGGPLSYASPNRGSMGRTLDHASVMIHPMDMASLIWVEWPKGVWDKDDL